MDLKQLKYFLAVAEERSFSRAAERLHISQPPLSQQIMKLEKEMGVRLFARTTRNFELTVAGKALVAEASALLEQMRMAVNTVQQIDRGEMGRLRVGVIGSAMWGPIPALFQKFSTDFPRVTWTLHELDPAAQYDALRARLVDIGFWRAPKTDEALLARDQLSQELYFREDVRVAINEHHPLARRAYVRLTDIASEPMLSLKLERSTFARNMIQCCVDAGFLPNIFQEASEPQTLLALVGAGLGFALMPETTARIAWPNVKFLPIVPNPPVAHLYVTYRTNDDAPVVRAFVNALHMVESSRNQGKFAG